MKMKKTILALGTIATVMTPIAAAVSCGDEEVNKKDIIISLGIPSSKKNPDEILRNLNDPTFTNEVITAINSTLSDADKIKTLRFTITTDNDGAAKAVKLGNVSAAFLPSAELKKFKADLKVEALSARIAFTGDTEGKDDSATLNGVIAKVNAFHTAALATKDATSPITSVYDESKIVDYYRAAMYTNSSDAKRLWDAPATKVNFDNFMKLGIITHSSTSASGYLVPQKMIANHFRMSNFRFANYSKKIKTGKMIDLNDNHHVYFSFLGEVTQSGNAKARVFYNNFHTQISIVALSKTIINDGLGVNKELGDSLTKAIAIGLRIAAKKNSHREPFSVYHHRTYKLVDEPGSLIGKLLAS